MRKNIFILLSITILLFSVANAAGHSPMDISKTDIFERSINFIIFIALMWYLVADKLKTILRERVESISLKFSQTQSRVKDSREKKEKAQQRLKEAQEQAAELIKNAKQEANIAIQRIEEKTKEQIANLIKTNEEAMEFQERLLYKQVVAEVLQEIFTDSTLNAQDYVNLLEKKVI